MAVGGPSGAPGDGMEDGDVFADINITPLTDIFLVLLIIFMVTTTAIHEADRAGFEVNLPRAGKGAPPAQVQDLAVAILADGRTVLGGRAVDAEELGRAFEVARGRSAATVVLVQADEQVAHGRVVAVMDLARRHGLTRLAIATRAPPDAR
ncbi:MAG TPA: biopolymer transporter ExbD [Anaeromyxobacteraceae bacterium]|nr:biopolymer transporter ExbD [Anaeromyxobacteraceae bacterium]